MLAVSSTMMPSEADRRAWLPVGFVIVFLLLLGIIIGIGPWMSENLAPVVNDLLRTIAVVFAISASVHLLVLLPTFLLRKVLNRLTGLRVIR
jgi:hypothetical protein